jgi:hypothetical protein
VAATSCASVDVSAACVVSAMRSASHSCARSAASSCVCRVAVCEAQPSARQRARSNSARCWRLSAALPPEGRTRRRKREPTTTNKQARWPAHQLLLLAAEVVDKRANLRNHVLRRGRGICEGERAGVSLN